jgi:uncharacterized membrane protein
LPKQEIIHNALNLKEQGKLTIKDELPYIPSSLKSYLSSSASYWYWIIIILSIVTTAIVLINPENPSLLIYARYVLGTIFILFLPGYSFIKALFPAKDLDSLEQIALSIGMSLVLVPITGLILNYTQWGIRTTPITLSLLALTAVLATAAIIREQQTLNKKNPTNNNQKPLNH